MVFSGPPAGLLSPSGAPPLKTGSTGGSCGGSGVAVPCGDHANIDGGGEIAGDAAEVTFSGVKISYPSPCLAPKDGCIFPLCDSGVDASGIFLIGDKTVGGNSVGGETAPPLPRPGC